MIFYINYFLYINDIHIVIPVEVLTYIDIACPYPKSKLISKFCRSKFYKSKFSESLR